MVGTRKMKMLSPLLHAHHRHPPANWKNKLNTVFLQLPGTSGSGGNTQPYAAFLLMEKAEYYYTNDYLFTPHIVKAKNWDVLQEFTSAGAEAINDLLDQRHEWIRFSEELYGQINPAGCTNLSPGAFNLLSLLQQYLRNFGGNNIIAKYLALLQQLQVPVFLVNSSRNTVQGRITIIPNPVELQISLTRSGDNLLLQAGLRGEVLPLGTHKAEIIGQNPPWLLIGKTLFSPRDHNLISLLSSFPISIPEKEANFFRENYLRRIAESLPITSDLLQWRDVNADPVPRLYLHDDKDNTLRADLRFGYGDYEVPASKKDEITSIETVPDSWELIRIQRQPKARTSAFPTARRSNLSAQTR